MSEDVFPRRNLPAASEPWGRKHDEVVRLQGRRLAALELASQSANRANAGQLGLLGRQVQEIADQQDALAIQVSELNQRYSASVTPANLQLIRGSSAGESGPVSRAIDLPGPLAGRRTATIFGSGTVAWTGTITGTGVIADGVTVGMEVRQSGTRRWFDTAAASSASFFTFSTNETFSAVIPVQVPAGGSTWDIRMWVGKTSSGGQTNAGARLENMNFSIVYGDSY